MGEGDSGWKGINKFSNENRRGKTEMRHVFYFSQKNIH